MPLEIPHRNFALPRSRAKVFEPANRCIYCADGQPPFSKEHIVPRGFGGGMILPKASCTTCQAIIKKIETYCLRRPFLPYRLANGLVHDIKELGDSIPLKMEVDGKIVFKRFKPTEFPNYLCMPNLTFAPGVLVGRDPGPFPKFNFWVAGDQNHFRDLNAIGNAILVEKFNTLFFFRVVAKIAHGFIAGEIGMENFDPVLQDFILGEHDDAGSYLIGGWPEDAMPSVSSTCQIGMSLSPWGDGTLVHVRLRLFPCHKHIPIYHVVVGTLTKPVEEIPALRGREMT